MTLSRQYLLFSLSDRRFGLELAAVERVIHAVEITRLPEAPPVVQGLINVRGRVLPVINLRRRFERLDESLELYSQLVLVRLPSRPVALVTDQVLGIEEFDSAQLAQVEAVFPGVGQIKGVARLGDDLVLIQDLEAVLSATELEKLQRLEWEEHERASGRTTPPKAGGSQRKKRVKVNRPSAPSGEGTP